MCKSIWRKDVKRMRPDSFSDLPSNRTRGNKLKPRKFQLNTRKHFFAVQKSTGTGCRGSLWSPLPWDIQNLAGCYPAQRAQGGPAGQGGWTWWSPEVPSNFNHSVILLFNKDSASPSSVYSFKPALAFNALVFFPTMSAYNSESYVIFNILPTFFNIKALSVRIHKYFLLPLFPQPVADNLI